VPIGEPALLAAAVALTITVMRLAVLIVALTRPAVLEALALVRPWLHLLWLVTAREGRLLLVHVAAHVVAVVVRVVVRHHRIAEAAGTWAPHAAAVRHIAAALGNLLFAESHDDAVVVLGVLQIVFGENRISARLRIARQRHVLLGNMSWRAAYLDVRPGALEAPRQRILALAVLIIIIVVVASASAAIMLSLPHCL
jgi:hypothetical protein